jgi:prepilin-type N-terminal cleavage/methylation domain-containing protein
MRKNGFTLIELIMVISIIAVLAGLLIPIIGYAKTLSKNAKCTSQLGTISASLSLYKDANGFYPEQYVVTADDVDPENRYRFTDETIRKDNEIFSKSFTVGRSPPTVYRMASALSSTDWMNVAEALLKQLQTVDRGSFSNINALRDPFTGGGTTSKVFRYRPAKFYPFDTNATDGIDKENPPNPDSYQLWSAGTDGKDQHGDRNATTNRKSDDITNWATP